MLDTMNASPLQGAHTTRAGPMKDRPLITSSVLFYGWRTRIRTWAVRSRVEISPMRLSAMRSDRARQILPRSLRILTSAPPKA